MEKKEKCYGDRAMMERGYELEGKGFKRVENCYWSEAWHNVETGETIWLDRCKESEKPAEEPATVEEPAPEYSHAATCLDLYLRNTAWIYKKYTSQAIKYAKEHDPNDASTVGYIQSYAMHPLYSAILLMKKHDHITPSPADIARVRSEYVAYILDCAK